MHRSRLSTFVIDCKTEDVESAAEFWAAALGRRLKVPEQDPGHYRDFECAPSEPLLMVQAVAHESRIHLDIESDDIEAEVTRLEGLGAKRLEQIRTWVVMQAPTGQKFCVVRPQRGEMQLHATTWPPSASIAFQPTPAHERLHELVGRFAGETKTWLDADKPPELSKCEWRVEKVGGGRWVRAETHGMTMGQPHQGEITLGFANGHYEMAWVDSFHTADAIMRLSGPATSDAIISVTGSYAAGDERWGWRSEFHLGNELTVRAINISPSGQETPAIETTLTR